ncbi:MAG: hypothetical protein PHN44_08615 [Candidatus Marinimicrobia bacterium]|nr:hypothetical protein [Candidatus Neomarinimicrobiota bacterium]
MPCPKQIVESMQLGLPYKAAGQWYVQFSIVLGDGTEGRIFRYADQLSNLVDQSNRAYPINGLHFCPPELVFSKTCKECEGI